MISCIICSRDKKLLSNVSLNIKETIGVPFEIISIENSDGKIPICKAYNSGAASARFNHLVFVHEDVLFHTAGWGTKIVEYLTQIKNVGCIGIAGGTYKTKAPTHWGSFVQASLQPDLYYLIQHYKNGKHEMRDLWLDVAKKKEEAVLLDGVFLAINKDSRICFDESMKGFHCYDLSVCVDALEKGYKNFVTREILIEHFSSGSFSAEWIKAIHRFHLKNAKKFPLGILPVNVDAAVLERVTLARFIELSLMMKEYKIAFYWWTKFFIKYPFGRESFYLAKILTGNKRIKGIEEMDDTLKIQPELVK